MSSYKIGFIGLGNMGAPMAANLAAAGHTVTGFDTAGTSAAGVTSAATAEAACADADFVITMLPNGAILRAVATQILPAMKQGATLVDCSTVDVDSARDVAAKICNNMILGATMIATCEAFALADKLGLDRQKMFDVASTSSGSSWSMNTYCPAPGVGPKSPADNDYAPGFAAELMLKDLGLSQQAAAAVDADTPMGALAAALYAQFVEDEDGRGKDFSAMLPRFAARGRSS